MNCSPTKTQLAFFFSNWEISRTDVLNLGFNPRSRIYVQPNPRSMFIKIMNCLKQNTFLFQLHYRLVNVSSIRYNLPSCYSKVVNPLPPVPWCLSSKCLCLLTVCTSERSWMDFGHWRARSLVSIMSDPRSLRYLEDSFADSNANASLYYAWYCIT